MKFSDISGHKTQINKLRQMVDNSRIPHAILIHGLSGLGKMKLVRAFISYICCDSKQHGDSCGCCPSCRQVNALNFPDIHYTFPYLNKNSNKNTLCTDYLEEWKNFMQECDYMQPELWLDIIHAGNSQPVIYVAEADEISRLASLSAYSSNFKIFVIWLPEKLQIAAANKLLKLIEEPFSDTLFILVSNNPAQILPTIYSRCQRIEVNRLSDDEIFTAMTQEGKTIEEATEITRLSEGRPAKAFELASHQGETEEFGEIFRQSMRFAYSRNVQELKKRADFLAAMGREKCIRLLDYFATQVRENFILNLAVPTLNMMNVSEMEFSQKFAPFIHVDNVEKIEQDIDNARKDISRNANGKLVWFDFMLRLMINIRIPRPS